MAPTPSPALTGLHDIFYHILPHLTPSRARASNYGVSFEAMVNPVSSRKALACLARSHSTFTRPALAAMWRSLPDLKALEHLVFVLGIAQQAHIPEWVSGAPPLELCGTPETHGPGWMRFREYASLVREIVVDPFFCLRRDVFALPLEDSFWYQMSSAFGDTPILPHLEVATVVCGVNDRAMDAGVLCLLNPAIRELYVAFSCISKGKLKRLQKALLKDCVLSMQSLEVLSVEMDDIIVDHDTFLLDLESIPRIHPRLRSLKLDHFRGASVELSRLRHLAVLPGLADLTVNLRYWERVDWSVKFQALRNLTMTCTKFLVVGTFLAHADAPQLQTLSVSETSANIGNTAQELLAHLHTLITKCPALTSFKWRSISQSGMSFKMPGYLSEKRIDVPLAEFVAPLLTLGALKHFSVSFSGLIVPYTPVDLHAFAEAWPCLETFNFFRSDSRSSGEEHYADVECIIAFARLCPRLRSLDVPMVRLDSATSLLGFKFDSTGESAARPADEPLAPRHWLRELSVHDVYVSHPRKRSVEEYKEDTGRFHAWMEQVFPSAVICIRSESWMEAVLTAESQESSPAVNGDN